MAQQESIDPWQPLLKQMFAQEDGLRRVLEALAQQAMSAEVEGHLRAARHERTEARSGYRNGSKPRTLRTLRTRVGELELEVPQVRGCEPYHPSLFARWQRSERAGPRR